MGIIGWIFAGIAVGILVGALIRSSARRKSSKRHAVPWAASRHSWNSFTTRCGTGERRSTLEYSQ